MKANWLNHWQGLAIFLITLVTVAQPPAAIAQNAWQPAWTIGVFDQSSGEFHSGTRFR